MDFANHINLDADFLQAFLVGGFIDCLIFLDATTWKYVLDTFWFNPLCQKNFLSVSMIDENLDTITDLLHEGLLGLTSALESSALTGTCNDTMRYFKRNVLTDTNFYSGSMITAVSDTCYDVQEFTSQMVFTTFVGMGHSLYFKSEREAVNLN